MAACLTMLGFVPQIVKILKTKHARDISLFMLIQSGTGTFLWILYGMHIGDPMVFYANIVSITILSIVIVLYLIYKSDNGKRDPEEISK
jgi:MtN3 and saliva related transmembrane protein